MIESNVSAMLREHEHELRRQLFTSAGEGVEPEAGSDAALLVDALCGATPDEYLPNFEASARRLAEQGGRLEARLAGLQRYNQALTAAIAAIFAADPQAQAHAQAFLGAIIAQIVVTLTREFQAVRAHQHEEEAEQARRGITRLQALQRINSAANSTLDLDQTLSTAAQAVAEEMHADLCVIFLFDEVTRELQLRATSGPYPRNGRHYTRSLDQGYSGWVAEHGRPLIVTDATTDQRFVHEATSYPTPYRGLLSVPIIFFTMVKLQGVISVQTREPHTFTEEDLNFLEIVAGQLAMNIENAQLYEQTDEELRRKVHELSALHGVSALVTSTLVLDNVLRIIVAQAVLLTGADRSILFELDPASQRLNAVASHGFENQEIMKSSLQVGQCCVGRVVQTGNSSMLVDCMRSDEGCFLRDKPDAIDDQHAVLCAPLSTVRGPLGALCVFSSQRHMLDAHQLQLVVTFANVAAIAMENARLFEQTRQGLRTKEVLLREMHHRVKNNLQQLASILNMQRRRAKSPEVEQILSESVDLIQGIAATHDLLSNTQLGMAQIDEIARKIVGIVRSNLVPPQLSVRFHVGAAPFHIPSEQATNFAIILNELIANAIEHGFEGRERGMIRISSEQLDDHVALRVADNGVGLPQEFSLQTADGLGLQLVRGLVHSNMHGTVRIFRARGNPDLGDGVSVSITDPAMPAVKQAGASGEDDQSAAVDEEMWTIAELRFPLTQPEGGEDQDPDVPLPRAIEEGD